MKCIESDVGQNANDISGPLSRTLMDSGQNVLNTLHSGGWIRRVPTNQMILRPNASTTIRLDELNKILREMEQGDDAKAKLAELDAQAGFRDPAKSLTNLNQPDPAVQPIEAAGDGVLTDAHIAQGQLSQAERMANDAQNLLNEKQHKLRLKDVQVDRRKMPQLPPKLNLSNKDKWKNILEDVEKKEIPVEVIDKLVVNLVDGSALDIEIGLMLKNGDDPGLIYTALQKQLDSLDDVIDDIDFHINIDAVVNTIQPVTDKILKNL
jgi:hypothetical protein